MSSPRAIGPEPESSGKTRLLSGPTDLNVCRPVQLVDPAGHRTQVRVALESCLTPQALEHGPRAHETCGRARGLSEPGASPLGQLVDRAGHRAQARLPGRAGQTRGPADPSTSGQGVLVDTAGLRTRLRVARECLSTSWAIGPGPESPGRAGQPRRHWNTAPGRPRHLVKPAGPQAWARVSREG